jgi:hypothetical protein
MAIGPNVVDDCEGMTEEDYWRAMDEAMQDEEGDEPFCNCTTGHSIEETDWNQCDSCGKPIYDEEPAVPPAPTFEDQAKDSERYRLLRRGQHWSVINGIGDTLRADQLDAAIDAELATHNAELRGRPLADGPA